MWLRWIRLLHTKDDYVYGAAAKKLEYNVYEENKVLKAKKKQKSNGRLKMKVIGLVILAFSFAIVIMLRYAVITELSYKIDKYNTVYNTLKDNNTKKVIDIQSMVDLGNIKKIAEDRLGMQKPDKFQIVYVKVPRTDFTDVSVDNKNEKQIDSSIFNSLYTSVNKLVGLLN